MCLYSGSSSKFAMKYVFIQWLKKKDLYKKSVIFSNKNRIIGYLFLIPLIKFILKIIFIIYSKKSPNYDLTARSSATAGFFSPKNIQL